MDIREKILWVIVGVLFCFSIWAYTKIQVLEAKVQYKEVISQLNQNTNNISQIVNVLNQKVQAAQPQPEKPKVWGNPK